MLNRQTLTLPPSDLATLQHLSAILHLIHHRNKNQHRHSLWWRHFSTFRKQFTALLEKDLIPLTAQPTTHLARAQRRKRADHKDLRMRITQRLDVWESVMVEKWQRAFSQVVADARFAALGLVLVAVLAQSCGILGITRALEEGAQREVEAVIEKFGREFEMDAVGDDRESRDGNGEDVGEVVDRAAVQVGEVVEGEMMGKASSPRLDVLQPKREASSPPPTSSTAKRKKRRKGNAIDDLFSRLD